MRMEAQSSPTGDEVLASGAVVHWDDRDGRRIAVTCGECGEKSYTSSVEIGHSARKNWRCHACGTGKRRGNETHSSGTVIHWSVRPPRDPWNVSITCYKCGADRFIRVRTVRAPEWNGQCSDCYRKFGPPNPRKRYEDELKPSDSVVLWSRRDECKRDGQLLEVWVRCGICGAENLFHRQSVKPADFEGYCQNKHSRAEILKMFQALARGGNGHAGVTVEKRPRGRQAGDTLLDYDEFVAIVRECVMEEWQAVGNTTTEVKQQLVLARYHNKCRGDRIAASTFKSRLVTAGYNVKWPKFVELTVKQLTSG